ncbi:hypothetical protein V6N13_004679 [Hibiscus sabdariffa]|uniref:Uncharacterized protein n=1 Tax=Hibiscus sabdariffa TaxID=183260 RepID=A0ABR2RZT8_9ROSI
MWTVGSTMRSGEILAVGDEVEPHKTSGKSGGAKESHDSRSTAGSEGSDIVETTRNGVKINTLLLRNDLL